MGGEGVKFMGRSKEMLHPEDDLSLDGVATRLAEKEGIDNPEEYVIKKAFEAIGENPENFYFGKGAYMIVEITGGESPALTIHGSKATIEEAKRYAKVIFGMRRKYAQNHGKLIVMEADLQSERLSPLDMGESVPLVHKFSTNKFSFLGR